MQLRVPQFLSPQQVDSASSQGAVPARSISPQKPHTASDLWHTGPGPHIQLPCRTACRRCLALPEPRALAPALCSVAAVGTVQSDSRAWHTARDLRSLLPSVSLQLDGPLALTHASPSVCVGPMLLPPRLRSLLTLAPILPQMPDTHNTHPKNHSAGGRHW